MKTAKKMAIKKNKNKNKNSSTGQT
uniref:Uncharacterized protein n=1 Tax=Rhizophora mucronata TaxID=61149 RepID=A0A2P2QDR1_RHIMU